jgi:hypothetical protein
MTLEIRVLYTFEEIVCACTTLCIIALLLDCIHVSV